MLIRGLVPTIIFSVILFLSAGNINYTNGWIFFGTNIVTTLMHFFAMHHRKELAEERLKVKEGSKSWDKILLGISAFIYLVNIIIAGLDSGRFHWSPEFAWPLIFTGVLLTIAGQVIFLTAMRENRFFSSVVRIQEERGHIVIDTGIYKIVRHPGYVGMVMALAGIPLITGSEWSIIPTSIAIILLFIRTALEDITLKNELPGYQEYSKKTRYKLIPWVW